MLGKNCVPTCASRAGLPPHFLEWPSLVITRLPPGTLPRVYTHALGGLCSHLGLEIGMEDPWLPLPGAKDSSLGKVRICEPQPNSTVALLVGLGESESTSLSLVVLDSKYTGKHFHVQL